eukprot:3173455-Ditylum_brightwellii.AAC.1
MAHGICWPGVWQLRRLRMVPPIDWPPLPPTAPSSHAAFCKTWSGMLGTCQTFVTVGDRPCSGRVGGDMIRSFD